MTMTIEEIEAMLEEVGIPFNYYQFAAGVVDLPYGVYWFPNSNNFGADNIVYSTIGRLEVELYTSDKDISLERKIEKILEGRELFWQKYEGYIKSEDMYGVVYGMEVILDEKK